MSTSNSSPNSIDRDPLGEGKSSARTGRNDCDDSNESQDRKRQIGTWAQELGFPVMGVTHRTSPQHFEAFQRWLQRGYAGSMHYLAARQDAYQHVDAILPGCRSVLVFAIPYSKEATAHHDGRGRVARYASCTHDYHDVLRKKLKTLAQRIRQHYPHVHSRGIVDTAPLLERDFANLAGLGWIGKNTLLLTRTLGSYVFLATLLTTLELESDSPFETHHCGSCRACLDACPTQAFPEPFQLDATKCISYLTIEHRGDIDSDHRQPWKDWLFGCDICQEVCPWNRKPNPSVIEEFLPQPAFQSLDLIETLQLTQEQFDERFRKHPLARTQYKGLLRNAMISAWNQKLDSAKPILMAWSHSTDADLASLATELLSQWERPTKAKSSIG